MILYYSTGKLDSGAEMKCTELKTKIASLQNELTETQCANQLLEKQLASSKEEVLFLDLSA